jgi:hypothetical protein
MRAALVEKDQAARSTRALASYQGGALTVADFMRWVNALGPQWAKDLAGRPDSSLRQFVKLIAQNQLLLRQADSAGIKPTPGEWEGLMQHYQAQVDTLRMSLDLSAADLSDSAVSAPDRARVASLKIESSWDRIAAGASRPRPIPSQLAAVLRQGSHYKVSQAGLVRAVELAREKKAKADSAGAQGGGPGPQPGPGAGPSPAPPPAPAPGAH